MVRWLFRGESANSQLSLDSETAGAYRELFRIGGGNNITFENLQLVRVSNGNIVAAADAKQLPVGACRLAV